MQAQITAVKVWDKDKNNNPLTGQYGPYVRVGIKATATNQSWDANAWLTLMCKPDAPETKLKVGMAPDIEVEQKGDFWNWKPVKHNGGGGAMTGEVVTKLFEKLNEITAKLGEFDNALKFINQQLSALEVEPAQTPDEIPF